VVQLISLNTGKYCSFNGNQKADTTNCAISALLSVVSDTKGIWKEVWSKAGDFFWIANNISWASVGLINLSKREFPSASSRASLVRNHHSYALFILFITSTGSVVNV
jgi:hypothetical protein